MQQSAYLACLLLFLTEVLTEFCDPVTFLKLDDYKNSAQSALVESLHADTLTDCMKHVTLNSWLLWFVYNKDKKECVAGQCWNIHLDEQMTINHVLYRKQVPVPRTCADVQTVSPDAEDGEYWIYPDAPTFLGCPTKIYCHDMASASPSEDVSLSGTNIGVVPDKQNTLCEGETSIGQMAGNVQFKKIRVHLNKMSVYLRAYAFAVRTGLENFLIPYGSAQDCYSEGTMDCGPVGTFDIDTTETGMVVNLQQKWSLNGYHPHNVSVTRSADGRQIHLLCGGTCGGCGPEGDLRLHRNSEEVLPHNSARFVTP